MIDPGRSQFPGFYAKILAPSEAALHQPPLSFPVFLWTLWSIKESVYKFVRRHEPDLTFGPTKIVAEIFLPIAPPAVLPGAPSESAAAAAASVVPAVAESVLPGTPSESAAASVVPAVAESVLPGTPSESAAAASEVASPAAARPVPPAVSSVFQSRVRFRDAVFHTRSHIFPDCISTVVSSTDDFTDVRWGLRRTSDASSVAESAAVRKYFLEELCLLYPDNIWALDKSPAGYPILLRDNQPSEIPVSFAHHGGIVGYAYLV